MDDALYGTLIQRALQEALQAMSSLLQVSGTGVAFSTQFYLLTYLFVNSWSRNGRYLLSASKDWTCAVWDLLTAERLARVRFSSPLMMAHMHPRNK